MNARETAVAVAQQAGGLGWVDAGHARQAVDGLTLADLAWQVEAGHVRTVTVTPSWVDFDGIPACVTLVHLDDVRAAPRRPFLHAV